MKTALFLLLSAGALLTPQSLVPGKIIEDVTVSAAPGESYALYLPSAYSPARSWPLILAFDHAARGRTPVERYQAAAERYACIVAGSNR